MVLPVYGYGHSLLRKVSEDITPDYPGLEKLIYDMFDTMYSSKGVGLAAPQVGINIRLFIIDATPYSDEVKGAYPLKNIFINAHIIKEEGDPWLFEEGCLSVPEIREDVLRPPKIRIRYVNEKFEKKEETFDGMMARIIQHEYDHLDGILFVDHVSNIRKMLLRKKLNDIITGHINPGYRMKYANPKR